MAGIKDMKEIKIFLQEITSAVNKQISVFPIKIHGIVEDKYICSVCYEKSGGMRDTILEESDNYCRKCGQKIDWSKKE